MISIRTAVLTLSFSLLFPLQSMACSVPNTAKQLRAEAAALINAQRRNAGLTAFSSSRKLQKIAQDHACDNANAGKWSHSGQDGSDLTVRLKRGGYRFRAGTENVGRFTSAPVAVKWWMGSRSHRANILSRKTRELGLGVAIGADKKLYWVMVGATPR
jgi:uncharacterized protein YkwD